MTSMFTADDVSRCEILPAFTAALSPILQPAPCHYIDTPRQADAFFTGAALRQYDFREMGYSVGRGMGRVNLAMKLRGEKERRYTVLISAPAIVHIVQRLQAFDIANTLFREGGCRHRPGEISGGICRALPALKEGVRTAEAFCPARDWAQPAHPLKVWAARLIRG